LIIDCLDGFQLLHLIHAVESFLAKLRDRGCLFNILWFDKEADVCMSTEIRTDNSRASKYRLARAVLIQHFSCPTSLGELSIARFSRVFPDIRSSSFREYLDNHPLHFFLGSNAHDPNHGFQQQPHGANRHHTPLEMLYLMSSAGYCVAFIEGVEFKSSKVYQPQRSNPYHH
jgi:ATP-dependent RNA helicase DDX60